MIKKRLSETYACQFQTAFLYLFDLSLTLNKPWFTVHFFSCICF